MKFDIWSAIFGAFGLGVLKLLFDVYKYYRDRRDRKDKELKEFNEKSGVIEQLFYDLLSGAVKIQETIEALSLEINAARILIFKVENGGGIPQLGTVQHMTVLNEVINHRYAPPNGIVTPVKQDFQNYDVDMAYQKLLTNAMKERAYTYTLDAMDNSVFMSLYKAQGIQKGILVPVVHVPGLGAEPMKGFFIFMSIQFTENTPTTPKAEFEYTVAQEKIKGIYQTFYAKRVQKLN